MISKKTILIISIFLFLLSLYTAIFCGHTNLSLNDMFDLITGKNTDNTNILEILRIPRVLKGIIAGTCLAVAGLFMQNMTKNPLVEPYITGVSSGAGIALVLGILLELSPYYYPLMGFSGAIISTVIVMTFAGINRFSLIKLILVGLSINIFAGSIISILVLTNSEKTHNLMMILAGNLNSSVFVFKPLFLIFLVSMGISIYLVPKLNFLRLDTNIVSALSKKKANYGIIIVVLSAILAATSVCAAGILGFVGIIIPHISRLIVGCDFRWLFFVSAVLGSAIVLFSDFVARTIIYPMEIPLGIILSVVGAPLFILFLIFKGKDLYA